jgi:D-beta-D-heptose 7-phosphate kinase/D-beta-D-heptose 1-phosphate adenosyltransferase
LFAGRRKILILRAVEKSLESIAGLRMLVIGDVMLDHYIVGDAVRISPEAPVPVVAVEGDRYTLGAAANVAHNLANLGCAVEVAGKIGADRAGRMVEELLRGRGIAFADDFMRSGTTTITKARVVARGQQLCRIDREGGKSSYTLDSERKICEKIAAADGVILSDYGKGTLSDGNVAAFVEAAREANVFIALDPKPAGGLRFSNVSLLTPNMAEAEQLAGVHGGCPLEEICTKIMEKYAPRFLAVTLGAAGMCLCGEGILAQIPTYAREVFDVSGAGDTVIACLTAAIVAGESPLRAARFANVAAGIVVSKHGTAAISAEELRNSAVDLDLSSEGCCKPSAAG